jgi:predicted MFS family arabinose efflux permease
MATLFSIVFLSHQLGSFVGVWVGGYVYDLTGSYHNVWLITSVLGLGASLLHIFIDDKPLARLSLATQKA